MQNYVGGQFKPRIKLYDTEHICNIWQVSRYQACDDDSSW